MGGKKEVKEYCFILTSLSVSVLRWFLQSLLDLTWINSSPFMLSAGAVLHSVS